MADEDTTNARDPWAKYRLSPEQREALLAGAQPFDVEEWQKGAVPPTAEELADLEDWLREREAGRRAVTAPSARIHSPRLANPGDAADFEVEVREATEPPREGGEDELHP
jgi:hypothetical protein